MPVVALLLFAVGASLAWITDLGGTFKPGPNGAVTEAVFRSTWIDDSDLARLATLTDLRALDLAHTRITDLGFRSLRPLANIESVDLYYAEQIGDGATTVARSWRKLKRLNMRGTKITDAGVAQLAEHPTLEAIDVGFSLFTDGGFEALTTMPRLRELACGGNKITDTGINYVRLMPNLRSLDVSGTQRTDSGPWAATVTDRSMEAIATLAQLEHLNLRGGKFTAAGAARLSALKRLRTLDISETQIASADLAPVLRALPALERLSLFNCKSIDDTAVTALAGVKTLQWLDLTGTAVTKSALEQLRKQNPKLKMLWGNS